MLKKVLNSNYTIVGFERIFSIATTALFFFFIASKINKEDLGEYNWATSLTTIVASICSLGIENVITRRIAVEKNHFYKIGNPLFSYLTTIGIVISTAFYIVYFYSNKTETIFLYLFFGSLAGSLGYFVMLCRQAISGLEKFKINSTANIINTCIKIIAGVIGILIYSNPVVLFEGIIIANFLTIVYYYYTITKQKKSFFSFSFDKKIFQSIIKESLPLLGIIVFNSALSRFDWIFMGIYQSMKETAEYTFAYRIYEITWVPHFVISTIVIPKLSRICADKETFNQEVNNVIGGMKFSIIISIIIPTLTCIGWTPLVDYFTNGKYGAVNQNTIEILCIAVPFYTLIGMQWNILIALKKSKIILWITVFTSIFNIAANIILIKHYSGYGASIANLISNIFQLMLYFFAMRKHIPQIVKVLPILFTSILTSLMLFTINHKLNNAWIYITIIFLVLFSTILLTVIKYKKNYLNLYFEN
ncbi:oligosaccharide flippase family protein [Solitalea sp. MAHUQ-68]|uniref:Oligosaccharide flippase family protein n=1 Tax=Solitalea agri TaxID=2953739 RepID=A0A9X2JD23_9SPHI|nr:oligosaccharide flippase family protein [Solitalea agri]MCO4293678.1 oligosaccharide flippase family protein [Solitalea agri]